jgi:hypothetical protein
MQTQGVSFDSVPQESRTPSRYEPPLPPRHFVPDPTLQPWVASDSVGTAFLFIPKRLPNETDWSSELSTLQAGASYRLPGRWTSLSLPLPSP